MRYLVDANVLSEPTKPEPNLGVVRWLRENEREIAVDPIILGEIRFGILLLRQSRRRSRLEQGFDGGALTHDLTVVTRNTSDFRPASLPIVDPFSS